MLWDIVFCFSHKFLIMCITVKAASSRTSGRKLATSGCLHSQFCGMKPCLAHASQTIASSVHLTVQFFFMFTDCCCSVRQARDRLLFLAVRTCNSPTVRTSLVCKIVASYGKWLEWNAFALLWFIWRSTEVKVHPMMFCTDSWSLDSRN